MATLGLRRLRIRLSVGAMMALVLVFGLWLGRRVELARQQRRAVEAVRARGGWVHYDHEFVNDKLTPNRQPWAPAWLGRAVGDEFFRQVRYASFIDDNVTGTLYNNRDYNPLDEVLALLSTQKGLRHLYLQKHQATDGGLAGLRGLTRLEDLYIRDAYDVSDAGMAHLEGLGNLKSISIYGSKVTDAGLLRLAQLHRMKHLYLSGHPFSDRGLAAVESMERLTSVWVGGRPDAPSRITDEGLAVVADLDDLEELGLCCSQVTDEGLRHLANLRKLRKLQLSDCAITDEGLAHIAHLDNLEWLLLSGTRVSDAGLQHLTGLKKLSRLDLPDGRRPGEGRVTAEAKQEFAVSMPTTLRIWSSEGLYRP